MIADGGSTIYEAWALDLPVVFPSWLVGHYNAANRATFEADVYNGQIGRHASAAHRLPELVAEAAADGITGHEQDFVESILPRRYRGCSGRLHAEALDDLAAGQPPRHASHGDGSVWFVGNRGQTLRVPAHHVPAYDRSNRWRRLEDAHALTDA